MKNGYIYLIIALLIAVAIIGTQLSLFEGTSTTPNTETRVVEKAYYPTGSYPEAKHAAGWNGVLYPDQDDGTMELIVPNKIPLSWKSDEWSDTISLSQLGATPGLDYNAWGFWKYSPFISKWWWQVEVWDGSKWNELIGKTGIISANIQGQQSSPSWGTNNWDASFLNPDQWEWYIDFIRCPPADSDVDPPKWDGDGNPMDYWRLSDKISYHGEDHPPTQIIKSSSNSFKIKGNEYAGLFIRASLCSYWFHDDGNDNNPNHGYHSDVVHWVVDDVLLEDGSGDIIINPSGNNNPIVFEEKQTMTFKLRTGFSGEATNPWRIQIYDPLGNIADRSLRNIEIKKPNGQNVEWKTDSDDAEFYVPNYLTLADEYSWYLAEGTKQPGDENGFHKWRMVLTNTVTEQANEWFFVVEEGQSDTGPINAGGKITVLDEPNVRVEVWAEGNPEGTNQVSNFLVEMQKDGMFWKEETWTASSSMGKYVASRDLSFPYDGQRFGVKVAAVDSLGIPSNNQYEDSVIPKPDGQYALNIIVNYEGAPAVGASVVIDNSVFVYTGGSGMVSVSLPMNMRYKVTASYKGYQTSTFVFLNENPKTVTIEVGGFAFLNYLIPIIIFVAFLIVALLPMIYSIPIKVILIVVGAIIAIFAYLILAGIIFIPGLFGAIRWWFF
jgi:hypothetical protein